MEASHCKPVLYTIFIQCKEYFGKGVSTMRNDLTPAYLPCGHGEGKVLVCVFVFQPHPCLPAGRPHPSPLRRRGEMFVYVVL